MENQTNTSRIIVSFIKSVILFEIMQFIDEYHFIFSDKLVAKCRYLKVCFRSFTYNHHMSQDYASDVLLEPIIWIVDNFSGFLGPVSALPLMAICSLLILMSSIFLSVLCDCGCRFDISCSCDCTFRRTAILLAKECIDDDMSCDIWILASYKRCIPLLYGSDNATRISTRCKLH